MKTNSKYLLWIIITICVLMVFPVSAQDDQKIIPSDVALPLDNPVAIDDIDEPGADGEIGLAYLSYNTTVGTYAKCSTDAFFYMLLVNESSESASVVLPRRAKVQNQYYYVENSAYTCKDVNYTTWTQDNYADANGGSACVLDDNVLDLPAHSVISVRGKVVNFSHEISRENKTDSLLYQFDIQINNKRKNSAGALYEESAICKALEFLEVSENNRIEGGYFIDPTASKSCSMNYFFIVENSDLMYSNVVELPRWIDLNNNRWSVGCSYLYDGCKISGFRHYAWAILEDGADYHNLNYQFCDQDRAFGNNCYEENTLWWLRIPPQTKIAVRGMVNNLCGDTATYPFFENYVHASFEISDAGSNKWWVDGEIAGTPLSSAASNLEVTAPLYSQISDRDPDEEVTRYLFEDPSLGQDEPVSNETDAVNQTAVSSPADIDPLSRNDESWYRIGDPECDHFFCHDFHLPPTGFPANRMTLLNQQPTELAYKDLGNYQIEIPALDVISSIVGVPQQGDTWAVQWLGENSGLLEGSELPGEGLSVIAAHNHIDTGTAGPFAMLSTMEENDRIFIRKPGGDLMQYAVSQNLLLKPEAFSDLKNVVTENSLVLITCENESVDGGYLNRRVIIANPS